MREHPPRVQLPPEEPDPYVMVKGPAGLTEILSPSVEVPSAHNDNELLLDYHPLVSHEVIEQQFELTAIEGLDALKDDLHEIATDLTTWIDGGGLTEAPPLIRQRCEAIKIALADCFDLIRYQNDALTQAAPTEQLKERAENLQRKVATLYSDNNEVAVYAESGIVPESNKKTNVVEVAQAAALALPDLSEKTQERWRKATNGAKAAVDSLALILGPRLLSNELYQEFQSRFRFNEEKLQLSRAESLSHEIAPVIAKNVERMQMIVKDFESWPEVAAQAEALQQEADELLLAADTALRKVTPFLIETDTISLSVADKELYGTIEPRYTHCQKLGVEIKRLNTEPVSAKRQMSLMEALDSLRTQVRGLQMVVDFLPNLPDYHKVNIGEGDELEFIEAMTSQEEEGEQPISPEVSAAPVGATNSGLPVFTLGAVTPTPPPRWQSPQPDSVLVPPAPLYQIPSLTELKQSSPEYQQIKVEWLEKKQLHEAAQTEYREVVSAYYASLNDTGGVEKFSKRLKASLGFKATLPKELVEKRKAMLVLTANYTKAAQAMKEEGRRLRKMKEDSVSSDDYEISRDNKKLEAGWQQYYAKDEKVRQRYAQLLNRSVIVNSFETQLAAQSEAAEALSFKSSSNFFTKNKRVLSVVGAAAIGAAGGGLAMGGIAAVRALTGGVVTGALGTWLQPKFNAWSERDKEFTKEQYKEQLAEFEAFLTSGNELSAETLNEIYSELEEMYARANSEEQVKIALLLSALVAASLVTGLTSGAAMEYLGVVPEVPVVEGETKLSSADAQATKAVETPVASEVADPLDSGSEVPAATASVTYEVERGDNFWDVMEGQTAAKSLPVMEQIPPAEQQAFIKLLELKLNSDDALRAEIGFGDSASEVQAGATLNLEKLNEAAAAVAQENGSTTEVAAPAVETPAPAAEISGTMGEGSKEATAAEAVVNKSTAEQTASSLTSEVARNFALKYPDGFKAFEQDFKTEFIEPVQGPDPKVGFFAGLFGVLPEKNDAFAHFASLSLKDFDALAKLSPGALSTYLETNGLAKEDFTKWQNAASTWQQNPQLNTTPAMRFEDAAQLSYVAEKISNQTMT